MSEEDSACKKQMPRRARGSDAELNDRFETIEERLAELQTEMRGELWYEVWQLSRRVLALERKKPKRSRQSRRKSKKR